VVDAAVLVPFRLAVQERGLGVEGVHVHQRDQRPVEHYTTVDNRRNVHSVAKTFTAVAVGIARDEGVLDLDDSALSHLPEFAADAAPGAERITVRHLLNMTAGNDYRWEDPDADHQGDPLRAFFAAPVLDTPGEVFRYRGTNSYVLGRIIHRHYGQDLRDFLLPRLFAPLGIANPQWHRCPLGYPLAADGLFLRTGELARLAETLLENGAYRGRRIVSADFVGHLASDVVLPLGHRDDPESSTGYGLHVWQCTRPGTWRMDGLYGQFGIIVPDLGACISLTGHYEGSTGDILRAVWSELLPALAAVR
jgi:CubicO group peptidase (beta-lactamase class C family)